MKQEEQYGQTSVERFEESQLKAWKLVRVFNQYLSRAQETSGVSALEEDPRRKLHQAEYLGLLLWAFWNPVITSMRGLCAATALSKVQEEICHGRVSLGSFSEMQTVVDPALLEKVLEQVGSKLLASKRGRIRRPLERFVERALAVDSTLLRALPRMAWAQWRTQWGEEHAVRLHVKFSILKEVPVAAEISPGATCERAAWKRLAQAGDLCVGDRYYGESLKLLEELDTRQVHFIVRLRAQTSWSEEEPITLSKEDESAGVFFDGWVRLGQRGSRPRFRLIRIEGENDEVRLLTNLPAEQWPAALIAAIYRYRWEVELFFRWLKCLLNCRHFLCESERGVTTQLYLALIGTLLVTLWTGKRPNKRQFELIQFYFLGYATIDEVAASFSQQARASPPRKAAA